IYLALGIVVVFLDMFRYLDSLHMDKVKVQMGEELKRAATGANPEEAFDESWRRHFSAVVRFRGWTESHRIRPHLMSGVEFQMFVLVLAPLAGALRAGAVLYVTAATCAVMLAFELSLVYKFWLSTRDYRRALSATPT